MYSCDQSWIFSIITPVFSVTWSFRNHTNMLIFCSRNISDYYWCWQVVWHNPQKPLAKQENMAQLTNTQFCHCVGSPNESNIKNVFNSEESKDFCISNITQNVNTYIKVLNPIICRQILVVIVILMHINENDCISSSLSSFSQSKKA